MFVRRQSLPEILRHIAPVLIVLFGFGGFLLLSALRKAPPRDDSAGDRRPIVETVALHAQTDGIKIEVNGLVEPYREVRVPAEVSGLISEKQDFCRAGRYVEENVELLKIDRQDYDLAQEEASSAMDELNADIVSTEKLLVIAKKQYKLEERDFQREVKLRGVVSETALDQAERELSIAENSVVTLETKLVSLKSRKKRLDAALRKAKLDVGRTTIRAPVSGVIVSEDAEENSFVQRGTSLVVIEDTSRVEVKCSLRKEDLQWLWLSQDKSETSAKDDPARDYEIPKANVNVIYDLVGVKYRWQGELSRYDGIGLDRQTRTIPCRVLVKHPRSVEPLDKETTKSSTGPPALLRGMYVTVQIDARPKLKLYRVPKQAIRPGKVIWLVRKDGQIDKLVKQPIRIAQTLTDEVVIHPVGSQLSTSDLVVVSPLSYPSDGLEVREQEAP